MDDYGGSTKSVVGATFPSDLPQLPCGDAFVQVQAGGAGPADHRASVSALQPGRKYGSKKGVGPTDRFGATAQILCTPRPAIGVAAPTTCAVLSLPKITMDDRASGSKTAATPWSAYGCRKRAQRGGFFLDQTYGSTRTTRPDFTIGRCRR